MKEQKFRSLIIILFFLVVGCANPNPVPTAIPVAAGLNHQFRVYDLVTRENIIGAKVTLEKSDGTLPDVKRTNNEGIASLEIDPQLLGQAGRLRVEAEGYELFTQNFTIRQEGLPEEIPLNPISSVLCDLDVTIYASALTLVSEEEAELIVSADGSELKFSWMAERGTFNQTDAPLVIYRAPREPGTVTIRVTVTDPVCDTMASAEVELEVISPTETPTLTPLPTETSTATRCPVSDGVMLLNPVEIFVGRTAVVNLDLAGNETITAWQAEAGDLVETAVGQAQYTAPTDPGDYQLTAVVENECGGQKSVMGTISVQAFPTAVPVTPTPFEKPIITYHEILPGEALVLTWSWSGKLGTDQNFAVRFWKRNDPRPEARFSITWTKELEYEFSVSNYPPGEYLMNVAVMTGSSDGEHHEIVHSEDVVVVVPPGEPTLPPP